MMKTIMAADLTEFTECELESFLSCRELRDLHVMLPNHNNRADKLIAYILSNATFPRVKGKLRTTVQTVLAGHPSHIHYPFLILLAILTLAKLTFASILLLTSVFGVITLSVTGIYLFGSHFTINRERYREEKLLQLEIFKLHCLNEIEARRSADSKNSYDKSLSQMSKDYETDFSFKPKRTRHLAPAVGVGFFCAYTLLCTYYLSAHTVIAALGFMATAATMAGPLGIGIAVGLCAIVGVLVGYQFYRYHQEKTKFDKYGKEIKRKVFAGRERVIEKEDREKKYLKKSHPVKCENLIDLDERQEPTTSNKETRHSPVMPFFNQPRSTEQTTPTQQPDRVLSTSPR